MGNEIEAAFLEIDKEAIREKLRELGAELRKPETLMRRTVFYTGEHSYARVRDEGDQIVATYKNFEDDNSIMGVKEVNVAVGDYGAAIALLSGCGLKIKARQETKREIWELDGAEICIDTWPWIPAFIEIEGPTEEIIWTATKKLGLRKDEARFGAVDKTYQYYFGVDVDEVNLRTPEILFDIEPPAWVKNGKSGNNK